MDEPRPYAYPPQQHVRRHGPAGWKSYPKYRPWLRDEFSFRCVYCLNRETWTDMRVGWHIDHFIPVANDITRRHDYDNLLYLCPQCNQLKSDSVVLPDPCAVNLSACLAITEQGGVIALDKKGELICELLQLNDPELVRHRAKTMRAIALSRDYDVHQYEEWMGYPADLPDLRLENPPQNIRPDGIRQCCFEQRARGDLPRVY